MNAIGGAKVADYATVPIETPNHRHELDGGNWRLDPFRRIQIWVPDEPAKPAPLHRVPCPDCPGTKARTAKRCHDCATKARHNRPINHGTSGGWKAHKRRGEEPCDECDAGQREANRKYREAHQLKDAS